MIAAAPSAAAAATVPPAAPNPMKSALLVEDPAPSLEQEDAPAPKAEPKLEFRLIDDTPRAASDLAQDAPTARAAAPSPPPR